MRDIKNRRKNNVKVYDTDAAMFFRPTLVGPLGKEGLTGRGFPSVCMWNPVCTAITGSHGY